MSVTFAIRSVDEMTRDKTGQELICGEWVYKGNELDYDSVIPAHNTQQAKVTRPA